MKTSNLGDFHGRSILFRKYFVMTRKRGKKEVSVERVETKRRRVVYK